MTPDLDDGIFEHSPGANLPYSIDWTEWLDTGDTIETSTWEVPDGLTQGAVGSTGMVTTVWLSGGTNRQEFDVVNEITTDAGMIDSRVIKLLVRRR